MRHRRTSSNDPPIQGVLKVSLRCVRPRSMIYRAPTTGCYRKAITFVTWEMSLPLQWRSNTPELWRALEICSPPGSEYWCAAPGLQRVQRFCHILHKQKDGYHYETFGHGPPIRGEWRIPAKQNGSNFFDMKLLCLPLCFQFFLLI